MADIRSVDLGLLRAFDALMDERNVTRAANRLSLTQPAVSGLLARLRESFGDALFVRSRHGVVPTARAHLIAAPIRQILDDVQALLEPRSFDPASGAHTFTIAATDYALRAIIVPMMAAVSSRAPGVRVAVRPLDAPAVASLLERGELDLALMTPESAPPRLHTQRLFEERYVCAMRADHPQAGRAATLSLARFCRLEQVLVSLSGNEFEGVTDRALQRVGKQRRVVLSVASFMVVPELLLHSDLVAVLPLRAIEGIGGLTTRNVPVEVPGFTKTLVWHERTHRAPAQRWLRELLAQVCGDGRAL